MKRLMLAVVSAVCGTLFAADLDLDGTPVEITVNTQVDTLNVAATTEVTVAQDVTLSAKRMTGSFKLTKKGAGAIVVEAVDVDDTLGAIEVAAGTMSVRTHASAEGEVAWREAVCPVKDSFIRLDASKSGTVTGTSQVTKWSDADGRDHYVDNTGHSGWYLPKTANAAPYGRPVVDFQQYRYAGVGGSGDHATGDEGGWLTLNEKSAAVREVFFVCEQADNAYLVDADRPHPTLVHAGTQWGDVDWVRSGEGLFGTVAGDNYQASAFVRNGLIEIDGVSKTATDVFPKGFHIFHVRTTGAVKMAGLCRDRDRGRGGWKIAEAIIYERALTDAEAGSVSSYLNNKWLTPQGNRTVGDVTVADGATLTFVIGAGDVVKAGAVALGGNVRVEGKGQFAPTSSISTGGDVIYDDGAGLSVDSGVTYGTYSVEGDGIVVKTGAGKLVPGIFGKTVTGLDIREGTVEIETTKPYRHNNHWMHLDASDSANLDTETVGDATYVNKWTSDMVDTNGSTTKHYAAAAGLTRPVVSTNYLNGRPVIDFGDIGSSAASYLEWDVMQTSCRELFMVVSDMAGGYQNLVGYFDAEGQDLWRTHFKRGSAGELFVKQSGDGVSPQLTDGTIIVDGKKRPYNYILEPGFHVVYLKGTGGSQRMNSFANDRNLTIGGQLIAEFQVFRWDGMMDDANATKIRSYLAAKWLGGPYAFDRLHVAKGASLNAGVSKFVPKTLACEGTINAPNGLEIQENGVLSVSSTDAVGTLGGKVTLPATATVAFDEGLYGKLPVGTEIRVLNFAAGAEIAGTPKEWKVTGLGARRIGTVSADANGLTVAVGGYGFSLIVH